MSERGTRPLLADGGPDTDDGADHLEDAADLLADHLEDVADGLEDATDRLADVFDDEDELATLFAAALDDHRTDVETLATLGDDTRYRLVRLLVAAPAELSVPQLSVLVDVSYSAVSHALADLRDAGLATVRTAGRGRYYDATRRAERLVDALDETREDAGGEREADDP